MSKTRRDCLSLGAGTPGSVGQYDLYWLGFVKQSLEHPAASKEEANAKED